MRQPARPPFLLALLTLAISLSVLAAACSDAPPIAATTQPAAQTASQPAAAQSQPANAQPSAPAMAQPASQPANPPATAPQSAAPAQPASQPANPPATTTQSAAPAQPANPPAPALAPPQPPVPSQGNATMPQPQSTPIPLLASIPPSAAYGDYAVGSTMAFAVDNRQRFDPWNAAYASDAYRETLRRVEAAGQTRTVVFQIWYPAQSDASANRPDGARMPYPAADGRPATLMDSYFQDNAVAAQIIAAAQRVDPASVQIDTPAAQQFLNSPRGSWLDAAPADGYFPLVILSHGLGGNHAQWASLAEFLASHGYFVAAPTFISDGSNPLVFHDPDSPFASQATPEEVRQAYRVLQSEFKVIPNFFSFMFANDGGQQRIIPGGIRRATTMMQNLFRQRVADVSLVAYTMRMLGEQPEDCHAALTSIGATSAARDLCGAFAGRVNAARIGLAGHSLGSMTSQLALDHLPSAAAAIGLNNGPPYTWTPEEMFGGGETPDGLPVGNSKPILQMIGDEDAFVQGIFISLFQATISAAGGDPAIAFPLDAERALPDRIDNPQPVALSAWQRATSDRALVIVRDVNHDILADDSRRGASPDAQLPAFPRKPTGAAALDPSAASGPPETYNLLDWTTLADGTPVYMPHLIRDWYARAWFDWHLKADQDARSRLLNPDPFGGHTSVRSEIE